MRERIDSYLDGWRTGDASRLLAGTADGFFFDDPNRGRIERDAYEAYVAELWVEARAYRGDERFDHFEDLSEIVTGEKGDGTLNVWFWWQIAGGGFVVLQGELHVRSAVLATNFSQPSELFEKFPHRDVFVAGKDGPGK